MERRLMAAKAGTKRAWGMARGRARTAGRRAAANILARVERARRTRAERARERGQEVDGKVKTREEREAEGKAPFETSTESARRGLLPACCFGAAGRYASCRSRAMASRGWAGTERGERTAGRRTRRLLDLVLLRPIPEARGG
jgi:hypothetical protein